MTEALRFSKIHNSEEVLDKLIETVAHEPKKPKWTFTQWALLAVLILVVAGWTIGLINRIYGKEIRRIDIQNVHAVGESDLCPGETLVISFNLHAEGTGKLVEDATVWIENPPKTAIYSETRVLLVDGLLEQEQEIAWRVPETYINPSNLEEKPLPHGPYRRIFAISSATDQDIFALDRVLFTIREDCNNE